MVYFTNLSRVTDTFNQMVIHMSERLILASSSSIRRDLLCNAGLDIDIIPARVDEDMVRVSLVAEQVAARDIADALAELKAMRVSATQAGLVLGCDQVLSIGGAILSKPEDKEAAREQLSLLRGRSHDLFSALVLCENGRPIWRHIGSARLTMRFFSDDWIDAYLDRNWPDVSDSVGAYKLEREGAWLFSAIEGEYFTILGLPLLDLLGFLLDRGKDQE